MVRDKRYLIFIYPTYYPSGGMQDSEGSYDTIEECKEALKKSNHENKEIYDRVEGVMINCD